jgi:hypothetical protein
MSKEEARQAVLSEYDRWAKKHPDDAIIMGAFSSFDSYRQTGRTFSISAGLATSGKSFTAGFEIGCKISLQSACALP